MTILEVPDTAGAKTVEVLAFVDRMLKSPGPLTQDQKTIVTQVYTLLTSFVNSSDITPDITELQTQNNKLSIKNAELVTQNLTLQTELPPRRCTEDNHLAGKTPRNNANRAPCLHP